MLQYIALALMAYIYFGWAFLHMGRILMLEKGVYALMYLYILTEFSEATSLFGSRFMGRTKMFSNISSRVTLEGGILAMAATLLLAWAMRHMLPIRTEPYWLAAGFIASFFGRSGDLFLSVIRKDLGIKESGVFIIGRDDILARIDKLVFTSPVFYYALLVLPAVFGE
jgi:phosphatidate cytidylyltransferase